MKGIKVIGETQEGKTVAGEFLFGIFHKQNKRYFVKTFDDLVVECVKCNGDEPIKKGGT